MHGLLFLATLSAPLAAPLLRLRGGSCPAAEALAAPLLRLRGGSCPAAEACLFDFDGTLAQSEDTHRRSFSTVLGKELTEEFWNAECVGRSPRMIMEANLPPGHLQPGQTIDDLLTRRSELFEEHIAAGLLEETKGASAFVRQARARGVRCAVVSSGSRSYIVKALAAMGVADDIELIVAGDDADMVADGAHHKPHPFPYLLAASKMGVAPEACVAFEDSLSGIRSAQAAGMRCVVIRNVLNAHLPVSAEVTSRSDGSGPPRPVNYLVDDFDALPLSVLDASEDAR